MKRMFVLVLLAVLFGPSLLAQEPVVPARDVEALFKSADPQLQANKMVVYHILRDLLQAGHWELADKYLTERYLQHNPNVPSGRNSVVTFFTQVAKVTPKPIPAKYEGPVVAVTAEGDLVTVLTVAERKDKAGKAYTTAWYDTWRIKDGKADEHWDCALRD